MSNMQINKKQQFFHKEESNEVKEILEFFLIFLITTGICGALFCHFFGRLVNMPQKFTDIIIETLATTGTNKSGELQLFWCLLVLGSSFLSLFLILLRRTSFLPEFLLKWQPAWQKFSKKYIPPYLFLLILPSFIRFLLYKTWNPGLLIAVVILCLSYIFVQENYKEVMLTFILLYYTIVSIFTIISHFSVNGNISTNTIYLITLVLTLLIITICLLGKKKEWITTGIYLYQFILPFLLMVFFVDTYLYKESLIRISYAPFYYVFFIVLWLICEISSVLLFKNKNKLIAITTPMLIFIYNSFSAAPMYAQPDQHHHGEQMIPWQQVFGLGQELYTEYTPVSGLFPMVSGTIQNVFLNGTVSDYSPAISITMVIFSAITMILLAKHVGNTWAMVFSVVFALPSYNRQYMVLPVLLFLTLPDLIKKKGLWLTSYVFCCFLAGLYYPLFGGALLVGLIPLGLWQLITYIQSGMFKADIKNPMFYFRWLVCLTPIILTLPLLFRMLSHTLTYSSQTILADGIALSNQSAPENFLFYTANTELRNNCYLFIRFFLPIIGVWLLLYLLIKYILLTKHTFTGFSYVARPSLLFGLVSGAVTLIISYSYTLVRADYNMVLSRTAPILISIIGIFLPVLLISYGSELSKPFVMLILAISFSLPMMLYTKVEDMKFPNMWVYPNGQSDIILDDGAKLFTYYTVPEGFYKAEDLDLSEKNAAILGNGFMVGDQISYINAYETVIRKCSTVKEDTTYLGFDGQGFYYFNDVKACATGFIPAAKGYEAQQAIIEVAEKNLPVIFLLNAESNYYIYYWMLENGYQYCAEDNAFYPPDLYDMIFGQEPADDYLDYYLGEYGHDLGLIANSLGNSYSTLKPLFTDEINIHSDLIAYDMFTSYTYKGIFSGKEYDFLYLKITPAKENNNNGFFSSEQMIISFEAADISNETAQNRLQSVTCTLKDGNLLIPMGMNPNWLLNNITSIKIMTLSSSDENATPVSFYIEEAKLLKIRQ